MNFVKEATSKFAPKITLDKTRASERAILKLWKDKNSWFRYNEIVKQLKANWPERTLARYLKIMEEKGLIEKKMGKNGKATSYRMLEAPKEYDTLEYLNSLRERTEGKSLVYDWEVSGILSSMAEGMLLGFPEVEKDATSVEREIISTLLVRISYAFSALLSLRNAILWRKLGVKTFIDDHIIRQYMLELQARKMNDTHLETSQLFELVSDSLCSSREIISGLLSDNEKIRPRQRPTLDEFELFELGDATFDNLLERKRDLREQGLDPDRFTIPNLLCKWQKIRKKIDSFTARQVRQKSKVKSIVTIKIPRYYNNREGILTHALNLKIAEEMKRIGLIELNDFGMVVTANRRALNKYFDTERLTYDAAVSTERFNRKLKVGTKEFAVEVAEMLANYRNFTEDSLRSLSDKVWFKNYFGDNLDSMVRAFQKQKKENEIRRTKEWKEERDIFENGNRLQKFLANASKLGVINSE